MGKTKQHAPAVQAHPSLLERRPLALLVAVVVVLLCLVYGQIIFSGKTLLPPDKLTADSTAPFVKDALRRGIFPLWTPYIFSGMPSYGSLLSAPRVNPIDSVFRSVLAALHLPPFVFILLNYLLFGSLVFLLLRSWKVHPAAAMFAGISTVFVPQFVAFTAFGHNTKFLTLVLIPLALYLTDLVLSKRRVVYAALLGLAIGFQLLRAHLQVSYYTALLIALYFVYQSIAALRDRRGWQPIWKGGLLLVGAGLLGIMLSAVLTLPVYEYSHYSIRGGAEGGLNYDYATAWSFSPLEMITFVVPSFLGFGGETYWGKMPFTDYPLYFGVVVLFFAGLALVLRRDRQTIFLTLVAVLALLVSFGQHFPLLYKPMFHLLPFFSSFRVPSMIHIVLDIAMLLLAGIGLHEVLAWSTRQGKHVPRSVSTYATAFLGLVGLVFLFLLVGKGAYISLAGSSPRELTVDVRTAAYNRALLDAFLALVFSGVSAGMVMLGLRRKVGTMLIAAVVTGAAVLDLYLVDARIIHPRDRDDERAYFAKTEAVKYLQGDPDIFRIYAAPDNRTPNWYMYHKIQSVFGYHAAKLRIYQEFIEESGLDQRTFPGIPPLFAKYWRLISHQGRPMLQPVHPGTISPQRIAADRAFLDMLNVKYVVSYYDLRDEQFHKVLDDMPSVFLNTRALPRAFFVDSVVVISGRNRIFEFMKSGQFDPHRMAVIETQPPFTISPAAGNQVRVVSYDIHDIELQAQVAAPTLLVVSEVFYPAGWKAYDNGRQVPIYKTNYVLRGLFLQPGEHRIRFSFRPASFRLGLSLSILGLLLAAGVVGYETVPVLLKRWRPGASQSK
ncbi:MAG: YfhO family protein [candidate division KSB1 bacterium]|nr:YfhO family protein [candidate division KSB1 bacterium]